MFVTLNQFYIFIACVGFGAVAGVPYSVILFYRNKFRRYIIPKIVEFLYFAIIACCFIYYSYLIGFPSLRGYMYVGVFLGIYLYVKSFHYILAKILKRLYNIKKRKN